jgi:hypothetical protein
MAIHLQGGAGCFFVQVILLVPAVAAAVIFHSAWLLVVVPVGILILWVALAKWGPKRKVTPEQFADELEPHLLGTGGAWHWDDVTSVGIDDKRLERLRAKLAKFDNLILEERRIEFTQIIAALRRGEVPDVKDD